MNDLEGLLAGVVAEPRDETRWGVLADWLQEFDDPRRAELLRMHRLLLASCCEPDKHPERKKWQGMIGKYIGDGVRPCVPQETLTLSGGVGMTFSFTPPGSFLMGSNFHKNDGIYNEKPVHVATIEKAFFMGIYPVTQAQWAAVMGPKSSTPTEDNLPVDGVSWNECQEFCQKLSTGGVKRRTVRLPTEAEWEYACRAGTTTEWYTGSGETAVRKAAWYSGNSDYQLHPVGELATNAWGLYDMLGSVWEWCQDRYDIYPGNEEADDDEDEPGDQYVLRGGYRFSTEAGCRAATRHAYEPTERVGLHGFRVAYSVDDR